MIGIIGAMDEEVEQIVAVMDIKKEETKACMTFKAGILAGKDVVIVRSGIGKVNAAVCTQILVDDFGVDYVINTGIAGSLRAEIDIADIVISSDVLHHDMDATGFGYPLGQIPRMDTLSFKADERLIELAKESCAKAGIFLQIPLSAGGAGGSHPAVPCQFRHPGGIGQPVYLEVQHPDCGNRAECAVLPSLLQVAVPAGRVLRAF